MSRAGTTGRATLGGLTRVLLSQGLVSAEEIHARGLRASDASRSHRVAIVELGSPGDVGYRAYVVKQLLEGPDRRQGSPAQERDVYRLAAQDDVLARLVPVVHHADPDSGFLVLGFRPDLESVTQRAQRNHWSDGVLAAGLGAALGDWHRHAARWVSQAPVAEVPWVFSAFGDERPDFVVANPPVADFVARVERSAGRGVDDLLARAAGLWRPSTVIHGDLRFDNALVDAEGRIVLIDWEFGGHGDPVWDLAAAVQEMVSASSADDAASAVPVLSGVGLVLLRAYAARAPSVVDAEDFEDRLLTYTAARLLLRALQLAQQQGSTGRDDLTETAEQDRHAALATALWTSSGLVRDVWKDVAA